MESFREPNFTLVAEILTWITERYDPNAGLPTAIDTEQDRVLFIKAVAQFMATKANVRLNIKKLYRADGHAVKELSKVASLLYSAVQVDGSLGQSGSFNMSTFDLTSKANDMKAIRTLASEITAKGSALYTLLGKEAELRDERVTVVAKALEIDVIEAGMKKSLGKVDERTEHYSSLIENLSADSANLETKIEKKKMELERNKKRLQSLQSVRPAFMDEYEELEGKLATLYDKYVEKHRNLTYLENLVEEINIQEQEKLEATEASLRRMHEMQGLSDDRVGMSLMAQGTLDDDVSGTSGDDDSDEDLGLGDGGRGNDNNLDGGNTNSLMSDEDLDAMLSTDDDDDDGDSSQGFSDGQGGSSMDDF